MAEQYNQTKIIKELEKVGAYVRKFYKAKEGTPDCVACYRSYSIWIEVKTLKEYNSEGRGRSPLQILNQRLVEEAGGYYAVAHSMKQLLPILNAIDKRTEKET
jgi:hypothetical protein